MSSKPIGIFDSGVGGTSIWKEIHALLPHENTIYLADSKNAPYGPKGKDRIIELSTKNTELLLDMGCKLIVVACNTATTNAIKTLRENYDVPFIGIEPAIKPAALNSKTKVVGILATKGTLSGELFHKTSDLYAGGIEVVEQDGEGIVPLIESGQLDSEEMNSLLGIYMRPMIDADIDYLVLGCSHYPYLIPQLIKMLPKHVKIIDSGAAVAKQTNSVLEKLQMVNPARTDAKQLFYSNTDTKVLETIIDNGFEVKYLDF